MRAHADVTACPSRSVTDHGRSNASYNVVVNRGASEPPHQMMLRSVASWGDCPNVDIGATPSSRPVAASNSAHNTFSRKPLVAIDRDDERLVPGAIGDEPEGAAVTEADDESPRQVHGRRIHTLPDQGQQPCHRP